MGEPEIDERDMDEEATPSPAPTPRMLSWARNSAAFRLGKRMHTEKQLSDAIARKAREKFEEISEDQVAALSAFAVSFGYDNKALDDVAYADVATRSGQLSGRSKRAISQRLVIKGIDRETATAAVEDVDDLKGAVILARKRAFGPFRKEPPDEKRKVKELSAFGRSGCGFEIGRRVYDMTRDEAEAILSGSEV